MAICHYVTFRSGTPAYCHLDTYHEIQTSKELLDIGLMTSPCLKLIRKEILERNKILFCHTMGYGEDLFFCWKAFLASRKTVLSDSILYGYRLHEGSETGKYHPNLYDNYKLSFKELKTFAYGLRKNTKEEFHVMDCCFTERLNSMITMVVRSPNGFSKKYDLIKEIINDDIIHYILEKEKLKLHGNQKLYHFARKGKIINLILLIKYQEIRKRLVQFLCK